MRRWRTRLHSCRATGHQHQLFCSRYLLQAQQRRRLRVGFLISPSVDGELAAMIIRRAGGVVIRGSSSHTGALALKGYFEARFVLPMPGCRIVIGIGAPQQVPRVLGTAALAGFTRGMEEALHDTFRRPKEVVKS